MSADTVLSRNEVKFYFTRAAVGAGTTFGIGEELAKSALWLADQALDPCAVIAPTLVALESGSSSSNFSAHGNTISSENGKALSAICVSPTVADFCELANEAREQGLKKLILQNVDQPSLVLARLALNAIDGAAVDIEWHASKTDKDAVYNFHISNATLPPQSLGTIRQKAELAPADMMIQFHPCAKKPTNVEATSRQSAQSNKCVPVSGQNWKSVYSYFEKCLVPSTEQSRQAGAGAGLTDND